MIVHFSIWEPSAKFGGGRVVLNNRKCLEMIGDVVNLYPSDGSILYRILMLYIYVLKAEYTVVVESTRIYFPFLKNVVYVEHNDEVDYLRINSNSYFKLFLAFVSKRFFKRERVISLFSTSKLTDNILPGIYLIETKKTNKVENKTSKYDLGILCSLDVRFNMDSIRDYVENHWCSECSLLVSGRRPSEDFKDYLVNKGVTVEENIDDVAFFYSKVDRVLVWDLYGVGLKTRIFEAMYYHKAIELSPNLLKAYEGILSRNDLIGMGSDYLENNVERYKEIWRNLIKS